MTAQAEAAGRAVISTDRPVGGWRVAFTVVALAACFADASIVVLGLPDMYADFFGATPFDLALVIVAYNFVVALVALAVHPYVVKRLDMRRTAFVGLILFLAASMACAAAQSIEVLTLFRFLQGLGAGLAIVSSLELLRRMARTPQVGSSLWGAAGFVGAAIGPAFGGVLTQVFGWRGIFVGVGCLAIPGMVALLGIHPERVDMEHSRGTEGRAFAATELLIYGSLVCALFLTIVMMTDIWFLSPIEAAGVLSTLPIAALIAWPTARLVPGRAAPIAGFALLSLSLWCLAFVPAIDVWIAVCCLGIAGFGAGLIIPFLNDLITRGDEPGAAAHSVGFRHIGLVLGIVIVGPLTWYGLTNAVEEAIPQAIAGIFEAPVLISDKLELGVEVAQAFQQVNVGQTPDLEEIASVLTPEEAQALATSVADRVQPVFTRALRWPFISGAILALLAIIPFLRIPRPGKEPGGPMEAAVGGSVDGEGPPPRGRARLGLALIGLVLAGGVALLAWEFSAGGASFGEGGVEAACTGLDTPPPATPQEAASQAITAGIYAAACVIGESPLDLVARLAQAKADGATIETLRAELVTALQGARAEIGETLESKLETLAEAVPVELVTGARAIIDRLSSATA
jgi:predicted MFS family arabinose efflux permease